MAKKLIDYLSEGNIAGKSFVCVEREEPRHCGSEFLNKPYKVAWLSCYKRIFSINVNFYNNPYDVTACLDLANSLYDLEASQEQIDAAKKERDSKLQELVKK